MSRVRRPLLAVASSVAAALLALTGAIPSHAAVVPVDPGPVAAGRPIVGTGQNLPSLGVTQTYDAGPGFAQQIERYYDSGAVVRDQLAVSRAALAWVADWVDGRCDGHARACKAMVVFDIDDTLLNNFAFYATADPQFSFNQDAYNAFTDRCGQTANAPVRKLYQQLQAMNVTLVVMSGRSDTLRKATRECLRQRGIDGWYKLVLKQPGDTRLASVYKASERRKLVAAGFRIVASVGDQVSDMAGGYLKRGFLMPDPMYFIP